MTCNDYICRRCGAVRHATADELEFGRVLCGLCGGTCDPSEAALRHLWQARNAEETPRPPRATTEEREQ
jgi:transcription initiation factor TFIIIB Brf1 subunit/transcription initiation factor TFIIB